MILQLSTILKVIAIEDELVSMIFWIFIWNHSRRIKGYEAEIKNIVGTIHLALATPRQPYQDTKRYTARCREIRHNRKRRSAYNHGGTAFPEEFSKHILENIPKGRGNSKCRNHYRKG